MAVVRRRKRVLVPPDRPKASYQPQLDHVILIMAHPVRAAALEFLNHARILGDALQSFSGIQHAIDSKKNHLSTSDLDYHLKELKKAQLIEQMANGNKTAGYLLTEKGLMSTNNLNKISYKSCMLYGCWKSKREIIIISKLYI